MRDVVSNGFIIVITSHSRNQVNWSVSMLCNNFKDQYSHFSHRQKPNVPTSSQNKLK